MSSLESTLQQQSDVLTNKRAFIIARLNPDDIIDELIQARTLIGENAAQKLQLPDSECSRREKNTIIVDELRRAGPGSLQKFCDISKIHSRTLGNQW